MTKDTKITLFAFFVTIISFLLYISIKVESMHELLFTFFSK